MKLRLKPLLICLSLYGLFLVYLMPAKWAFQFIPGNLGIELSGVSGSVWQGKAEQVMVRGENIEKLQWQVKPWSLFTARLAADVKFGRGKGLAGKGELAYGFSGGEASDLTVTVPVQRVIKYLPLPMPIEAQGLLDLKIKSVSQGQPFCQQLDGFLFWTDASVTMPMGEVILGDPKVKLECENGGLAAILDQQSDHLTISMKSWLPNQQQYRVEGEIKGGKSLAPAISQALDWIGPQQENGSYRISLSNIPN
ncbi:type II secretion system protein N [Motilimonas sp. 1_MG-2023]|uniref:type II secretion system protein N n=1 Tax=Motilimonas sp. 1_MG-2023 TaxID=3062672 RepID=UPI0026E2A871|nr:type II secretion system protein N [Motilimonas sp. 1_MG-2023]MDO6527363.1 type II secretion system protein N [Motilimonas sp. 1_MG-2023]